MIYNNFNKMNDKRPSRKFNDGEHFFRIKDHKVGTVRYLRNDKHERQYSVSNHYHVDFSDKTFDTYYPESFMLKDNENSSVIKSKNSEQDSEENSKEN